MLFIMGMLFSLSNQPGDALILPDFPNVDKYVHACVYALLACSALFALSPRFRCQFPYRAGFLVVLFSLLYGLTDEFHQSFVPMRSVSGFDLLADGVGAFIAVVIWLISRKSTSAVFSPYPWQNRSE